VSASIGTRGVLFRAHYNFSRSSLKLLYCKIWPYHLCNCAGGNRSSCVLFLTSTRRDYEHVESRKRGECAAVLIKSAQLCIHCVSC